METPFTNYNSVLKYEYSLKQKRNRAYSLRAFARDLGLSPSRLSEIFQEKQGLSPSKARDVGVRMGYSDEKLDWFCNLVQAQSARSEYLRKMAQSALTEFDNGVLEKEVMVDSLPFELKWYHQAIRRMTLLENFKNDPSWIASFLKIKTPLVNQGIHDLLSSGLLKINSNGQFEKINNFVFSSTAKSRFLILKMYRYFFYKAYQSYKTNSTNKKNKTKIANIHNIPQKNNSSDTTRFGAHTLTLDKDLYPELLELIKDFEAKLDHLTYKSKKHDSLMTVIIGAFPLGKDSD